MNDSPPAAPIAPPLADAEFCYLETVGRVSGRPHEVEMWYAAAAEGDRLFLLSGGRGNADWVKNIGRQPRVRVRIAGVWYAGSAAVVEGHPDDLLARQALAAKYYRWRGGSLPNAWAREALPVAIRIEADPVPSNGATG
ncbi:MAG: hypothetical protein AVDCRST_MAG73-1842 [uncultured Thermomicrobiales bacterium]|uniref:Nitroreductase family deazaflavin-dependent oxidoreductase n=1 Tax=uncultured Thermomicrobiales bacterium TaxID=1645740 RepID=A0A6J4U6M5_9BACT|nr:MAG: hypothetical protein AVDCRST_MAG73-1842 [uncultured Thermomicrobiales bacterium]